MITSKTQVVFFEKNGPEYANPRPCWGIVLLCSDMARAGCIFLSSFNFIGTFSRRQDWANGAPQPARHIGATTVQRYIFSPKPTKMCTFICFSKYNNPLQTPVIMNIKIDTNFRFSVASMQYLPSGELSITLVSDASPADPHYRPGGCSMLCRWSG